MEYIYIGKIVNTHGIKGELRILSEFIYKDKVFKKGISLYIGNEKEEKVIETYRFHKIYDMVTFKGLNYINDVLQYKAKKVFINKADLELSNDEILDDDLIGMAAYFNDVKIGDVTFVDRATINVLIYVDKIIIPYNKNFIKNIDLNRKEICFKNIEGLLK